MILRLHLQRRKKKQFAPPPTKKEQKLDFAPPLTKKKKSLDFCAPTYKEEKTLDFVPELAKTIFVRGNSSSFFNLNNSDAKGMLNDIDSRFLISLRFP